ncbi:hypothetical protein CRI94_06800 [Longibacter salinarum]|uniref:YigZ family protein n=1 Tax=Longibacter salinarum TaxID=1850348 RepID=A0A2A8CZL5_9BACT|nr:YigZ family protein [Longibacter salinarum]PEN14070.1 hypothetical protein CRI94_06800 [Longibacter salinarum]
MSDTYLTIAGPARAELKREGSKFIAEAQPVTSRENADAWFASVREREHTATHHCTAFRAGREGDVFHYNDDGEPSGTAGPPILRQIDGHDLTNTAVVVTRYYGGTKLGTGGLIRAYGDAAKRVLDAAEIVEKVVRVPVRVRFAYEDTSPASRVLDQFDLDIVDRDYSDVTEIVAGVRESDVDRFIQAFVNGLGDRGTVVSTGIDEKRDEG